MESKKFLSVGGLPHLLEKIKTAYAAKVHTHKASDVTDFSSSVKAEIDKASGKIHFALDDSDKGLNVIVDD